MKTRHIENVSFMTFFVAALSLSMMARGSEEEKKESPPMLVSEASQPKGFPSPGAVGKVIIKTYPAHRLARAQDSAGSDNSMFMKLFNHIKRNDIAMTSPVQMDEKRKSMAFLYGSSELGSPGPDPKDPTVVVEDIPEIQVLSVGLRGSYSKSTTEKGVAILRDWLSSHPEWKESGLPRTLGYNSPFVPSFLKYSEIQIPISPAGIQ